MVAAEPSAVYNATPVGEFRRAAAAGLFPTPGDPVKMADAVVNSVYSRPAPRRLALGSDAYRMLHATLTQRLAELGAQRAIALSTDFDNLAGDADAQHFPD